MHRGWRSRVLDMSGLSDGDSALDLACGTGDFLPGLRQRVGQGGLVVGVDLSLPMLQLASGKMKNSGVHAVLVQGDAENLPFGSNSFQAVTVGFALRNFADLEKSFAEICRTLKPGGRLLALEIARPQWQPFRSLFLLYFEKLLPLLARAFRGEFRAYRWLPASLAAFPSREVVLATMKRAGFDEVSYENLSLGAVCIYIGIKH